MKKKKKKEPKEEDEGTPFLEIVGTCVTTTDLHTKENEIRLKL